MDLCAYSCAMFMYACNVQNTPEMKVESGHSY